MIYYYIQQKNEKLVLLQNTKLTKLSNLYSEIGKVKAIINCSFFTQQYVIGRNQGDMLNEKPDQSNFAGQHITIKDNIATIGKFESWDNDIADAGFSPIAIYQNGKLEISESLKNKWEPNLRRGKTCLFHTNLWFGFAVSDGATYEEIRDDIIKKYNPKFIAFLDGGGSSEIIIDKKIQFTPTDGYERPMFNGLAFIEVDEFVPRTTSDGMTTSPYWNSDKYNFKLENGKNTLRLPNCTAYCLGRLAEIYGVVKTDIFPKSIPDARYWSVSSGYINQNKFETSLTPNCGDVCVWYSSTYGHVAIVEKVYQNGNIDISQSNYTSINRTSSNANYFQYKTNINPYTYFKNLKFVEFVHFKANIEAKQESNINNQENQNNQNLEALTLKYNEVCSTNTKLQAENNNLKIKVQELETKVQKIKELVC